MQEKRRPYELPVIRLSTSKEKDETVARGMLGGGQNDGGMADSIREGFRYGVGVLRR